MCCDFFHISCDDGYICYVAGASDPFCQVYVGDERKFVTQVKKKTLAPIWDERVTLELPKDDETLEIVSFLCF